MIEKTMRNFMECWKKKSFRKMIKFVQLTWLSNQKNALEMLKSFFDHKELIYFEIKNRKDVDEAVFDMLEKFGFSKEDVIGCFADIEIFIKYRFENKIFIKKLIPRLICESAPHLPHRNGKWGVNPISILKEYE